MPRSWRDWELLDESERLVSGVLVSFAGDTAVDKILNISTDVRPCVLSSEKVEGSVLAWMSCGRMIVLKLQDMRSKISGCGAGIGDVDTVVD
jgi:hypothetical protein